MTYPFQTQRRDRRGRYAQMPVAAPVAPDVPRNPAATPTGQGTGVEAAYGRYNAALLRPADAAARLGVSVKTLRGWVNDGLMPAIHLPSGHVRYRRADIDAIANTVNPAGPDGDDFLTDWDLD